MAWRNVLAAAYSEERVPRLSIFGAYLAGVGINAIVPVRAGDAVRVVLAHRAIPKSTYTTIVSSTFVLSLFDMAAASLLLVWAATTQDAFPGIGRLPDLPSFEFAWLLDHPLTADLVLAALFIVLVGLGFWLQDHVVNFWARVRQPFVVFRPVSRYFRDVAAWQAGDWALRLVTIWYMLDAFDIPQTLGNVLLVQVSVSVATLVPLTPAGIGSEQAFLLYVFRGTVESSKLLAFSVGMKLTIVAANVVMGFAAIALTLRTVRYSKALGPAAESPDRSRASRP
jgi:uncharacterized membrane protein YbhN (UPF0104 family)